MSRACCSSGPEGDKNCASSAVLYSWPLAVWLNIRCVRGAPVGVGDAMHSLIGTSLMPIMISAGASAPWPAGTIFAPAYTDNKPELATQLSRTHLCIISRVIHASFTLLHQDLRAHLLHELLDRVGSQRRTPLPYPSRVLASQTNCNFARSSSGAASDERVRAFEGVHRGNVRNGVGVAMLGYILAVPELGSRRPHVNQLGARSTPRDTISPHRRHSTSVGS